MRKRLDPTKGGCWFCHTEIEPTESYLFSVEMDANLHNNCLKETLEKDSSHPEARIIAREFDMELPVDPLDNVI